MSDLNEYQKLAKQTAVFPPEHALAYLSLGLVGEAGEVANKAKKLFRGDYLLDHSTREKLAEELGDVLWYIAMLADLLEFNLSSIAYNNIHKLKERQRLGTLAATAKRKED